LKGNHVFALSSCILSFHLSSPQMGGARGSPAWSSLGERNFAEVGTFQPSFGFKDFRQAARPPSPTNGQFGGEKRARLRPPPRPQLQGFSSSGLRRRSAPSGGFPPRGSVTLFFPRHLGGERHPPAPRGLPSAMSGKANCCCPARVQHSVLCPGDGRVAYGPAVSRSSSRRQPRQRVAQHVVCHEGALMFWGGLGEGGSEDLPVRFGAPGARWCGVEAVAAGEGFSANEIAYSACSPGPPSLDSNGWFSSFAGESPPAATSARKPLLQLFRRPGRRSLSLLPEWAPASHQGFCRPAGPPPWGLFVPTGAEPEFRL
jgi:hypothetical protein